MKFCLDGNTKGWVCHRVIDTHQLKLKAARNYIIHDCLRQCALQTALDQDSDHVQTDAPVAERAAAAVSVPTRTSCSDFGKHISL